MADSPALTLDRTRGKVRRPAFYAFLVVAASMVAAHQPFPLPLLLGSAAVLILPWLRWPRGDKILVGALMLSGFVMELSTTAGDRLHRTITGKTDVSVRGIATSTPRRTDRSLSSDLALLDLRSTPSGVRLRVSVMDTSMRLSRGDTLWASGSLRPLTPPANPGETDWSRLLRQRGIIGRLRVGNAAVFPGARRPSLRDSARSHIEATLSGRAGGEEGALALAMLIGIRDLLDQETMTRFRDSGIVHILSISGFHVGIVAALIYAVAGVVLPGFRYPAFLALVGVLGYVTLVGLYAPVLRAGVMSVVVLLGVMLGRRAEGINSLGLAGLLLLIAQPRWIWEPGFQLSFGATFGILVFTPPLLAPFRRWRRWSRWCVGSLLTSLSAQLGVLPILLAWFRQWPTYSLLANIPAVLLATVLISAAGVTSVAELVSESLATWSGKLTEWTAAVLLWLAGRISSLPLSVLTFRDNRVWILIIAWGAALGARIGRGWRRPVAPAMVGASCAVAAWLGWAVLDPWAVKAERISFLHVPMGNCVVAEASGAVALIDPGSVGRPDWPARIAGDHLRFRCTRNVEVMGATSVRSARSGALDTLATIHPAARILLPPGLPASAAGQTWGKEGIVALEERFRLRPLGGEAGRLDGLLITSAGGLRVLIAGDGGWQADAQCAHDSLVESADVLYVGPWRDLAPSYLLLRRANPHLVVIGGGTSGEGDILRDLVHAGYRAVATSQGAVIVEAVRDVIRWRQHGRS